MQHIYVNGQFLPADAPFITADDRSFRFGDGIFETMLVVNGRMYDAPAHFARLQHGLDFFRISLEVSGLEAMCYDLIAKNNLQSGYVRIVVSRGDSGSVVGYMPGSGTPYFVVQTVAKPFPPCQKLSLCVSQHRASLHTPCKTNSAMLYTLAMMEARDAGCDNAIILDAHGHVCETASGNLFWVKDGVVYTPEESLPMVPGTMRARVLELSPLPVKTGRYNMEVLATADEIFMSNVGTIVAAISAIPALGYVATGAVITRQLRQFIEKDIIAETQAQR